jgi:chemotaxis protein methyltransferase CheR
MDAKVSASSDPRSATDIEIRLLLDAIFYRFHYDFRSYSMASIRRRIQAAISRLGCETISALQEKILHEPKVFDELLQFLTVQVSDMFRDPAYFKAFRGLIVPMLRTYPSIKLWVAGCSSGEEAYSLAIILREEGLLERSLIYATDINPEALKKAEAGVYALERIANFSENYRLANGKGSLSEYYTAAYGAAVFDRTLRTRIVFSDHSLSTDHVFAEVQVVSCRNVLIYFDRELQNRALGLFKEALCRRGLLGLGAKETLVFSPYADSFEEFAREDRWYVRC